MEMLSDDGLIWIQLQCDAETHNHPRRFLLLQDEEERKNLTHQLV